VNIATISVSLDPTNPRLIVRPEFYKLNGVIAQATWDAAVQEAAQAGYLLVEAFSDDIERRWTFDIDEEDVEHHYLISRDDAEVIVAGC
jgi:hypothetical protein